MINNNRIKGLTTQERLEDISERCGLSIEVCRRVLKAESESVVESLKHGERATLIGRVTLRPELKQKITIGGSIENCIKVKADVSAALESGLDGVTEFIRDADDEAREMQKNGIRLRQLQSLL